MDRPRAPVSTRRVSGLPLGSTALGSTALGSTTLGLATLGLLSLGLSALADSGDPPAPLPEPRQVLAESFASSSRCALCHSNAPQATAMRDKEDRAIAPFDLWQSTMMANSARDPLWRAVVSAEIAATPSQREHIEQTCLRCHAPMASAELELHGERYPDQTLGLHLLRDDSDLGQLALDGVSCTVCHQIQPDGLGEPESFSGQWTVEPGRTIFGPHVAPFATPMRRMSGYTPTAGEQILDPGLCASCHTLFTEAFTPAGELSGQTLPEQTPFLEWRNSNFGPAKANLSCQDCHVPQRDVDGQTIETKIARNPAGRDFPPVPQRAPFGRHIFVGGNTLIPAILRDHGDELGVQASREAFDATITAARHQLESRAARLRLSATRDGDALALTVEARNLTGHKLPTAHPTRRVWLRVEVVDAQGARVFLSGDVDARGRLTGPDGQPLASELPDGPVQPHHATITAPTQVQIYESVMQDTTGAWTWLLTRGAVFGKDSRLLPNGWQPDGPDADTTRPRGAAAQDDDFGGGGDVVVYRIPAPPGPLQVTVSLHHQALGARYAAELFRHQTPEVRAFQRYYRAADPTGETLTSATLEVE